MEKNAHQHKAIYAELGIDLDTLGCIMLDVDGKIIKKEIPDEELYVSDNPKRHWIKGFVAGQVPHVTLLYGLLKSGNTTYRKYVDEVLNGWSVASVRIRHVGYFESQYDDEQYYCIVAHLKIDGDLREGHARLELLPHINTFTEYKAHITIAYIRKDEKLRDLVIKQYNEMLEGKFLPVLGINYGK